MNPLIVFYSLSGNTRRIAERIQQAVGGTLAEIETVIPYSGDYDVVVEQGKRETEAGFLPEIEALSVDPAAYSSIVLGTPVWWYTMAPAVRTFLTLHPLAGKTVYPFATNGGWVGHTFRDIAACCPDTGVMQGLDLRFDGQHLHTSAEELEGWIKRIR